MNPSLKKYYSSYFQNYFQQIYSNPAFKSEMKLFGVSLEKTSKSAIITITPTKKNQNYIDNDIKQYTIYLSINNNNFTLVDVDQYPLDVNQYVLIKNKKIYGTFLPIPVDCKIVKNVFHNILEQASDSCILKAKKKKELTEIKRIKNKITSIDKKINQLKQSREPHLKNLKELETQ